MAITVSQDVFDILAGQRDSHRASATAAEQEIQAATARRDQETRRADDIAAILDDLEVA